MIPLHNLRRYIYKACRQPVYALKVLAKRSSAAMHYNFASGGSSLPEAVTLFLTYRCNLRCKMCGQWGEGGVTKKGGAQIHADIDIGKTKAFVDKIAGFKPNITLFGGEPLLYGHCIELIEYIKARGMHCLMITNGSLIGSMAERIVKSGLDELNVSLDGNGDLHDEIRGIPGTFTKIMSGLKAVNELKSGLGLKKPLINIQCTINKENYKRLGEMPAVAEEAKANSLTFHNLLFIDRKVLDKQKAYDTMLDCNSNGWEGFVFEPGIDARALYEKMSGILKGKYSFGVDFYPNFSSDALIDYYEKREYLPSEYKRRCLSPWIVAYVFPDGEVRPCLNCSYSFGNIDQGEFKEIWNSEAALKYRRLLKKHGVFPACARCTELYRY